MDGAAVDFGEQVGPLAGGSVREPTGLAGAVLSQHGDHVLVEVEAALGGVGLAVGNDLLTADGRGGGANLEGPAVEVDVLPRQANQLGPAQAGEQGEGPQRLLGIAADLVEERAGDVDRPDLVGGDSALLAVAPGRLGEVGGVAGQESVADCVLQCGADGAVDVLDALGAEALVLVGRAAIGSAGDPGSAALARGLAVGLQFAVQRVQSSVVEVDQAHPADAGDGVDQQAGAVVVARGRPDVLAVQPVPQVGRDGERVADLLDAAVLRAEGFAEEGHRLRTRAEPRLVSPATFAVRPGRKFPPRAPPHLVGRASAVLVNGPVHVSLL